MQDFGVKELSGIISEIRSLAEQLRSKGDGIETIKRNVDSILAYVNILEINISDINKLG
jgi:hypothetical protein